MLNKSPKVSVIIPTYQREEALLNTLSDLVSLEYSPMEIIITDQTEKPSLKVLNFVNEHKNLIKYFRTNLKSSPAARNLAVKKANGELLIFVDDDVEIREKNFIKYHLENYADPEVGLVGGRVLYDFKEKPPIKKEAGKLKFFGLKEITNFNSDERQEIDHAYGCNFSCLRKVYLEVGGFGEIYKGNAHMEETDFSLRVKRAGYKLVFDPKAILRHVRTSSGGNRINDIYEFRYWLIHNGAVFYLKNYPKVSFPLFFIDKFFWACTSSLKRRDKKMFKTMYSAIINGRNHYFEVK
ncbi:TPA: glycosyltransferase family 2 protein [Candidatus Berkelbacteria bacterium]|uniref:Glycosyl transferase family protein n=1 Tax=Berkelbacteria bacterium GW2011_GWE1_39_12 TaxID=1618337 RepID=A0A0G4B2J1_9BACT|nr:MAG: glycosyl transferase family protein [Berkelbacteria bacterium GW2011_GWE1_39_12]HBO60759.1 glycosyltransferase family 2 protein [Candidatus Berkelbacteria bacterium]